MIENIFPPILPPATIGILGSGQLGRMLALEARQMGYRVHVLSPDSDSPTGQVADKEITAVYTDLAAVEAFAREVDVVTYEFENVPVETAAACAKHTPLRPGPQALHIAQNRLREKQFFEENGLPTAPYQAVHSLGSLLTGLDEIGTPAVLKTTSSGYDGKGQALIVNRQPSTVNSRWEAIGQQPAILERYVAFEREVSVVAARGVDGAFTHFGVLENDHTNHVLDVSVGGASHLPKIEQAAVAMTHTVLTALDVVGVLCVEFFQTKDGTLLLNEIAPRPHNSGHLTIEACHTSQFEQQLRAICGLPFGDTSYRQPAAMANLLGDLWFKDEEQVEPDWTAVLQHPQVHLHLYGKREPRPGRKMGHLTATANSAEEAKKIVRSARRIVQIND